jgi:hypothetical protein
LASTQVAARAVGWAGERLVEAADPVRPGGPRLRETAPSCPAGRQADVCRGARDPDALSRSNSRLGDAALPCWVMTLGEIPAYWL